MIDTMTDTLSFARPLQIFPTWGQCYKTLFVRDFWFFVLS
jgi:hypothetical protein